MTNNATLPQKHSSSKNCDANERLYFLIKKRVKRSRIVRRLATVDDMASDIFLLLAEQELPPLESEEFENLLTKTVKRTVRRLIRNDREMPDVDEVDEDEHPFYETEFFSDEVEYEAFFKNFCDSFSEPYRTVFSLSRIFPKRNIAKLTGLGRNTVSQIIKGMPEEFEKYFEEFSKIFSR